MTNISGLGGVEDMIGVGANLALILESLQTAITGQCSTAGYVICVTTTFLVFRVLLVGVHQRSNGDSEDVVGFCCCWFIAIQSFQ